MRTEVDKQDRLPEHDRDYSKAAGFAKDAAPFCHPRLSSIAHTGKNDGPIEFRDVPAVEVARRYAYLLTAAQPDEKQVETEH